MNAKRSKGLWFLWPFLLGAWQLVIIKFQVVNRTLQADTIPFFAAIHMISHVMTITCWIGVIAGLQCTIAALLRGIASVLYTVTWLILSRGGL